MTTSGSDELVVLDARTLRRADEVTVWALTVALSFALGALVGALGLGAYVLWVTAS